MFDLWQVPDHQTICSRMTVCGLCSIWRNPVLCFDDFALLRRRDSTQMIIMGIEGVVSDQSVPRGNRGEKSVICEEPFPRRNSLNIPGGMCHLCNREVAPDTPEEA